MSTEIEMHRWYAVIWDNDNDGAEKKVVGVIGESFPGDGLVLFESEQEWRAARGE